MGDWATAGMKHEIRIFYIWDKESISGIYRCGTKKFMAPEIIKDERFKKAGDIFAFAVTCYEMIERRRPEFESDGSTYVNKVLKDLIEKGWSLDPNSRPAIEKFVETARRYTTLMSTSVHIPSPSRRVRCLMDFFSKMEYLDFEKEMEMFKQYLADHRSYYLQNRHLYKKGNIFRNIFDKITNNNYHDDELWHKCSMHIFAPPKFSEQNRLLLEQEIRNRRKDFSENGSELSLISVEGGDCFIVIGNYSEGELFMYQCEEILYMPYPGRGTTSFPTVKDQRQLYPLPARNILFIGDFLNFQLITGLVFSTVFSATVVFDGERFNFTHWDDNADTLNLLNKEEFHLICIMEEAYGQDDNSYPKFDRHFEQFRGYCESKENIALLEFTTDETKDKLLRDDLPHVGLRLTLNETDVVITSNNVLTSLINGVWEKFRNKKNRQDLKERRNDMMKEQTVLMSLIDAARNAPVCCFE